MKSRGIFLTLRVERFEVLDRGSRAWSPKTVRRAEWVHGFSGSPRTLQLCGKTNIVLTRSPALERNSVEVLWAIDALG